MMRWGDNVRLTLLGSQGAPSSNRAEALFRFGVLRRLPDLVGHPGAEMAVFGLGLVSLHERDAGTAVGHADAIENGQVHERVVET